MTKRISKSHWDYDCAIIGGGPAGLVSSLYLRRFNRSVILIHAGKSRAAWIPRTHNLIGYDRGISGELLLKRLFRQVNRLGLDHYIAEGVVFCESGGFRIRVGKYGEVTARKVILATGFQDVDPDLENVIELRERGLLRYCSICDGYEYRHQPIAVLAQDDFGLQKGIFISHWTKDLRFIIPEKLKIAPQRIKEIQEVSNKVSRCSILEIEPCSNSNPGVNLYLDGRKGIYARVVYVELGCVVNSEAFKNIPKLHRTKEGFIIATLEQRTSVPGLFAIGDCVNLLGQISVAAGQAAVAATEIHNDLFSIS
jgi:thioredoxin reductase (NADPH)